MVCEGLWYFRYHHGISYFLVDKNDEVLGRDGRRYHSAAAIIESSAGSCYQGEYLEPRKQEYWNATFKKSRKDWGDSVLQPYHLKPAFLSTPHRIETLSRQTELSAWCHDTKLSQCHITLLITRAAQLNFRLIKRDTVASLLFRIIHGNIGSVQQGI